MEMELSGPTRTHQHLGGQPRSDGDGVAGAVPRAPERRRSGFAENARRSPRKVERKRGDA
jgi:hypothetical protein